jgi:hypothetical protein
MTTSFVSSLLPAMIVARWFGVVAPEGEHSFARPISALCERILDGERRLIGWQVSLPVGGTRVVVARKGENAP